MSGQWSYPGQFPPQAQWQQGGGSVGGMGQQQQYMMGPGGPIQMGGAQGIGPGLPQGIGVAQGIQGMGVAQPGYPGMPYQPVNSMTGVNMYYQQQPFYQVPPGAAPPTREDQLRLYEEQRMREKEEIKRREAEEKKRRDFKEQKRRLQSMNVLNPKVGGAGAVAMETLIGFTPSPKSKPKATPTTTTPPITTSEQAPPPLTSTVTPPTPPPASIKVATTVNTTSGPSIDELLSNTMSGLGDTKPNQRPLTKSDFKSTPPIRGIETRPSPAPLNKTYSVSTKAAKVWEKGGEELSGLFKTETSGGTNEISFSPGSDDGFGDFQSVTSNTATSNSVLASAAGRERVGGGGIRRALPLMTSPAVGSPVLVHYQSGGPPVMATTSSIPSPSLPTWLVSQTVELPDVYKEVYKRCSIDGSLFTHTESLFPLLISSDLDRSVLHDLWSAVNLTSPGQLTQTELYQLLGLIGLAQNRQNVKVTLHDLLMTPSPPVPTLKAINIINTSNEDDFCEFKASPLVPHKFDGAGSVGVASTPPTTQPASDPSDPYSALRVLAPPTNNDPGTQGLLTINKEPATQQQQNQQQIDQQRHHNQQHQILHQQQEQLPVINTDVQPSTGDGWADFTSFPDTSQPLTTPSIDTTTSSNIINMMNPTTTPVVVGGGPVSGGVAPAGASDGLIWSDDEFTEFSTYQSQDVSVAEPVLSSPSHTIGRGGGGGGGIVSPSPTSPMSSTSTDSNKSIGLSEIWCQCLQKCLDLLKDSQSLLTSSSNDEETLNIIINEREGQMKIKGLAELYRFAKRLHTSSRGQGKSLMSHSKSETLTELMLNIKKKWNEIRELFDQEKIDEILNTSSNSFFAGATPKEGGGGDKERCVLCLQPSHIFISPLVTIDGCSEDYQLATGFVSGRLFHVQCANFYKNCLSLDFEQIP